MPPTGKQDTDPTGDRKLSTRELVTAIVDAATTKGRLLEGVDANGEPTAPLSDEWRAQLEKQLVEAFTALRPAWPLALVRSSIEKAFTVYAAAVTSGQCTEDFAVQGLTRWIAMQLNIPDAPPECAGKLPDPAAVRTCLQLWQRKPGRPKGQPEGLGKNTALLALYRDLGLSGAFNATSIKKQMEREPKRKRRK